MKNIRRVTLQTKKRVLFLVFALSGPLIWLTLYFAKDGHLGWKEKMSMLVISIFGLIFGGIIVVLKR